MIASSDRSPECRVSVVIPNYNGAAWLRGCLDGLGAQAFEDFRVVLVDNGSTDGSPELACELRPDVQLVRVGENRGFAAAVNLGIAATKSAYVALLNTDTVPGAAWLSALVRALDDGPPELAAAAPRMLRMDDPATIDDAGNTLSWTGAAEKAGHGRPAAEFGHRREIFTPSAGASLYRRSFLEEMGGFDERYFAYLEDLDLGLRGRLCGYHFIFEPAAEILHKGHGSGMRRGLYVQLVTRNRLLLFAKNVPSSLLIKNMGALLRGQLYFLLVYRRPFRSLAGYASFVRLIPHVIRERRRMRRLTRIDPQALNLMLASTGDPLIRAALARWAGRWLR